MDPKSHNVQYALIFNHLYVFDNITKMNSNETGSICILKSHFLPNTNLGPSVHPQEIYSLLKKSGYLCKINSPIQGRKQSTKWNRDTVSH